MARRTLKYGAHDGGVVLVPEDRLRIYLPTQWQPMAKHIAANQHNHKEGLQSVMSFKGRTDDPVGWSDTKTSAFPIPYGLNTRTKEFIEDRQSGF